MKTQPIHSIQSRLNTVILHILSRISMSGIVPPQNAVYLPSNASYYEQALQCRKLLRDNLVAFYLPRSVDLNHGGYFETLSMEGFVSDTTKHLILQSRQLWFFSTLAQRDIETDQAISAAETGYRFLVNRLHDSRNGGHYLSVYRDGRPIDKRKYVYAEAFALYGLVAYYQATRSMPALSLAKAQYEILEKHAHDPIHGGVLEKFSEDWKPLSAGNVCRKSFNTHLHIFEAYASLYLVWPDNRLRQRLDELITIITKTMFARSVSNGIQNFHRDWRAENNEKHQRASYGHDLEAVWLVLETLTTLELSLEEHIPWAKAVCNSCLNLGFDYYNGGFFYSGMLGKRAGNRKKVWWVQAEAMVALLSLFRLTKQTEYYEAFIQTFRFVQRHQIAKEGGWWNKVFEDGSRRKSASRTGKWQGAYHSGRALMICEDILKQLANHRE